MPILTSTERPIAKITGREAGGTHGHSQYRGRANAWAGMVGPIIIDEALTGVKYLELLQGEISDALADLHLPPDLWWMHDGCPAHNSGETREFLQNSFPHRVIGSYEDLLAWPARSPGPQPM